MQDLPFECLWGVGKRIPGRILRTKITIATFGVLPRSDAPPVFAANGDKVGVRLFANGKSMFGNDLFSGDTSQILAERLSYRPDFGQF